MRGRLEKFCRTEPLSLEELIEVKALLASKGTLDYSRAKCKDARGKFTGPFSASAANAKGDHTGSSMFGSWLRDSWRPRVLGSLGAESPTAELLCLFHSRLP
ncbi:hypothetical protein AK812_SmicGene45466 [Symbiodinium microadriaticum]|uniref:Uncharacterized protein n=1 Tax=Symbiodinium microadriaticum TaxID=2951 RepID=A0A1Q9BW38_SYMMI|nr:hypothetical protein AK812_SmicGene45466 [Symbiodinium microadriaticum]